MDNKDIINLIFLHLGPLKGLYAKPQIAYAVLYDSITMGRMLCRTCGHYYLSGSDREARTPHPKPCNPHGCQCEPCSLKGREGDKAWIKRYFPEYLTNK